MSNDKSEASDVEMEDLCLNPNPKRLSNTFNMYNINEINSKISISEEDNILKDSIELEKNTIPKKEEIELLIGELAEIENNLNQSNDILETLDDIEDIQEPIFHYQHKTSGSNRRYPIKYKLEVIDYARANGRNIAAEKFNLAPSAITYWMKKRI